MVFGICTFGILYFITCMYLLTGKNLSIDIILGFGGGGLGFLSVLIKLSWPLAVVTETFEYDVLRALNNPFILNRAQKYIGQQLLSHLNGLQWGFRFCGTTITAKFVSK